MSEKKWKVKVFDILECIGAIEDYTAGMTHESFSKNRLVFDAVVRNIEIIGEASKKIPDDVLARYTEIRWRDVKGMRDIVVHDYIGINKEVVWGVVKNELPILKSVVSRMKNEEAG